MPGSRGPSKAKSAEWFIRAFRSQPRLTQASYGCTFVGVLLSIHDLHHWQPQLGFSTPILGLAIVLYLFGMPGSHRGKPGTDKRHKRRP